MRRKRIAVLMAGLNREYQQRFTKGMAEEAAARDTDLCIFNAQGYVDAANVMNEQSESSIFSLPDLNDFDAIVSLPSTMPSRQVANEVMKKLKQHRHIPQIIVDITSDEVATLNFDDAVSVKALVEHLLWHGVRSFAIITGPNSNPVSEARKAAALETIRAAGGIVREEDILCGYWTRHGGATCTKTLIERGDLAEAVICLNDDMALGAIDTFRTHGIRVPDDVRVTGFDSRIEAVGCGVTTIRRPVQRAGRQVVRRLLQWADGEPVTKDRLVMPTELVLGSSCGCEADAQRGSFYLGVLAEEMHRMEQTILRSSPFSSALFNVSSQDEVGVVLSEFASTWSMKDMHVCVTPSLLNAEGSGTDPDRMLLLSSQSDGKTYGQTLFTKKQLLPLLDREDRGPLALVFCPLYYSSRQFGYAVMDLDFCSSLSLYSVLSLLDGALMSLTQQNTIRAYARRMENLSMNDELTGLANRRGYALHAPEIMEQARRQGKHFAILSVDMDGMKKINDSHGHQSGDEAICRMAGAVRCLEGRGMTCVHISGDEFVAYGIAEGPEAAQELYEDLHQAIAEQNSEDPWIEELSASIGVYAAVPGEKDTPDDYLKQADRRMYDEKKGGTWSGNKPPNKI